MRASTMMRMLSDVDPAADDASTTTAPLLVTPASATTGGALLPPAGRGCRGSSAASVYPESDDTVVILAALLCVLVCALGLNSLVRCARGLATVGAAAPATTTDAAAAAVAAPAAAGLNKRELRKIPVVEYETSRAGRVPPAGTDQECAICLGEFVDGDKVRLLPGCPHGFHVRCIDRWLAAHSSCPICRNSLLEEEEEEVVGRHVAS